MPRASMRMERNLKEKWIRGQILTYLEKNAPESLNADMIWQLLDLNNYSISDTELLRHIDYLQGKGYLSVRAARLSEEELEKVFLHITPAGTDLVSGFTEDVGVEV